MRHLLKYLIYRSIGAVGVYRNLRRRNRNKAIVLTYHGVLPQVPVDGDDFEYRNVVTTAQFEKQIKFLIKHYRPLRAEDFYHPGRDISGGFLITFDDGFRNNFRYAMPVLKKYGLQGCFFITTGLIGTRELLWTEQVTRLLEKTNYPEIKMQLDEPRVFQLNNPVQKENSSWEIRRYMKKMPSRRVREILAAMKEQLSDVSLSVAAVDEERYLFMTWEEVQEMIAAGQLIGSHTHTHPMLATLSEEESLQELRLSKEAVETHTGRPCLTMSYPNGEKENYSQTQIQQLQHLGYRCAFTQIPLFNNSRTNRYELRRVNISLKMSMPVFEAAICGFI